MLTIMTAIITRHQFVELMYQITDKKTGHVLIESDFPLAYVHGVNQILSPGVSVALSGKTAGDVIRLEIDGAELYGKRDESLTFTDDINNVPKEYRTLGTVITMENAQGEQKNFIVTRVDEQRLTLDGNHPFCGRRLVFELKIVSVRHASEQEIAQGGAVEPDYGQYAVPLG